MEWVAVLLVPTFAVLGSIYCLWTIRSGWRAVRGQSADGEKGTRRSRSTADVLTVGAELALAVTFVVGAAFVAFQTSRTQAEAWWQASEANVRCENCLEERFIQGPNDSRLVIHYADSLEHRPVVFVDSTCQPIGDGDLPALATQFPETQDLLLGRTQVTDAGISELRRFKHLDSLSLQALPITDRGLERLAECCDLTFLDLTATSITDEGLKSLARLPKLEELRLCSTRVSDAGLAQLRRHRNLKLLALTDTAVTGQGIARLQQALPGCTVEQKLAPAVKPAYAIAHR